MTSLPLKTLLHSRDLLSAWTMRIIRARYQQSILGGLWAVLQPIAMVTIFTTVFSYFIRVDTGGTPYAVFAYTAIVPWMLFSTAMTDMVDAITGNMNLVSKIYFPREVLVIAALLARLLDFLIAYAVLIVLMLLYGMKVFPVAWAFLPLILLVEFAISLGVGLIGAALNVFYRDVRHMIGLILQIWFYATPIVYPVSLVPDWLRPYYYLNPMVGIIQSYRSVMIDGTVPPPAFAVSAAVSLLVLAAGYWLFKRLEAQFADII